MTTTSSAVPTFHSVTSFRLALGALAFQVIQAFRETLQDQTTPTLKEFDERKLKWENRLLPDIPDLSADALWQALTERDDGGLGLLPACGFEGSAYVRSKAARAVAQLSGQPAIADMIDGLPSLLSDIFAETT